MRPPLRLTSTEPIAVLAAAKRAALKADVSLAWWVEFSSTARSCLTADCEPEELSKFIDVVSERFDVTFSGAENRARSSDAPSPLASGD